MEILKMSPLEWLIFWLSIGAYGPLVIGVIKEKNDKSQVATTWILYFLLDTITMFSTLKEGGNFVLLFGFSVGSFIMAIILLYQGRIYWGILESVTITLVFICIIVWNIFGAMMTIVSGILSEIVVGIYLIIKTYKNPRIKYNLNGYIMFLIVSILALHNAKSSNVKEIGYALAEIILSVITLIPLIKKWWIKKRKLGLKFL
jgi:hypothetical protein